MDLSTWTPDLSTQFGPLGNFADFSFLAAWHSTGYSSSPSARSLSRSPSSSPPSFTQSPSPPRSLVRDGQTSPHSPAFGSSVDARFNAYIHTKYVCVRARVYTACPWVQASTPLRWPGRCRCLTSFSYERCLLLKNRFSNVLPIRDRP